MTQSLTVKRAIIFVIWLAVVGVLGLYTSYLTFVEGRLGVLSLLLSYLTLVIFAWGLPEFIRIERALFGLSNRKPRRLPKLSLSPRLMLILIIAFGLFLIQVAYGLVMNSILSGKVVYDVLSVVVAVEGVLLGLLSLSPERRDPDNSQRVAGLAFITFIAILISLSTIIFAETSQSIDVGILSIFFLMSVWLFAVVVITYAAMIMRTPRREGSSGPTVGLGSQSIESSSP